MSKIRVLSEFEGGKVKQIEENLKSFTELVIRSEDWLMNRILYHAKMRGYSKYTSTLKEAWRLSISGLSHALLEAIRTDDPDLELSPDELARLEVASAKPELYPYRFLENYQRTL